jgi:hypothetical protein
MRLPARQMLFVKRGYQYSTHEGTAAVAKHKLQQETQARAAGIRGRQRAVHGHRRLFVWQIAWHAKPRHLWRRKFYSKLV